MRTCQKSSNKKSVGMVVAIEMDAVFSLYPECREVKAPVGFREYVVDGDGFVLHIVKTGMGEIAASAGVQYLATKYGVSAIVNFGVVGGLTAEMKKQKVCLVKQVVHYKYDCSEFMDLKIGQVDGHDSIYLPTSDLLNRRAMERMDAILPVTCCSGDKFISTPEEKQYLHDTFGGDICDMESAGIVLACEMNDIPCLMLKAVSDGLSDGAGGFYTEYQQASVKCLEVVDKLLKAGSVADDDA